ncbi:uncharacterized protein LOC113294690 [Papaver somniferum]|uniref:uncharacterized protein LOC113294690 n=1 Tax=Papaver somniferum TaxID=3469 RepID=UPI000E704720|nr:uncharacterized protein LOC113294690 [Papaver somniferum]
MLDAIVEEVGEEHVVQVVTDNAPAYKAAGNLLMRKRKKLYWTPCVAHCIDLMLEKLFELPQMKNAYLKANRVANCIYSHGYVLDMMRSFTKRGLIRPGDTRFATANLTLQSLLQNKQALEEMFTYNKWKNCEWLSKSDGKDVKKIILRDQTFWPGLVYSLKEMKPLVGVLRLVDAENVPAMEFIYGAMDMAKEALAAKYDGDVSKYREIWNIIDEKWDFQMHRDLHAAGYFLNLQFQYEDDFSDHTEIRHGLYNVMEKLLPREDLADAHLELDKYCNKEGCFGRLEAEITRKLKTPDLEELDFPSLGIDTATQNDEPEPSDLPAQQRMRERDSVVGVGSAGSGRGQHSKRG